MCFPSLMYFYIGLFGYFIMSVLRDNSGKQVIYIFSVWHCFVLIVYLGGRFCRSEQIKES